MNTNKKLNYFIQYAIQEARAMRTEIPQSASESERMILLARFISQSKSYPEGDPNLDAQKRNLSIRTFLDFDIHEIRAHGLEWLRNHEKEHGRAPWYKEWYKILNEEDDDYLARIYLSSDQVATRIRVSRPTGLLSFDVALKVKREGVAI